MLAVSRVLGIFVILVSQSLVRAAPPMRDACIFPWFTGEDRPRVSIYGERLTWQYRDEYLPHALYGEHKVRVVQYDVLPLLEDLVTIDEYPRRGPCTWRRVNDLVADEYLPHGRTRCICLQETRSHLFWNPDIAHHGDVRLIAIRTDEETGAAWGRLEITPAPLRVNASPRSPQPRATNVQEVRAGDLIACEFQAYRVLNVVPPVYVEKLPLLRLIGWVELDPEPIPPPEEPAEAPEAE